MKTQHTAEILDSDGYSRRSSKTMQDSMLRCLATNRRLQTDQSIAAAREESQWTKTTAESRIDDLRVTGEYITVLMKLDKLEHERMTGQRSGGGLTAIISEPFGGNGQVTEALLRSIGIAPMALQQLNASASAADRAKPEFNAQLTTNVILDGKVIQAIVSKVKAAVQDTTVRQLLQNLEHSC